MPRTTKLYCFDLRNDIADGRSTVDEAVAFQLAVAAEDQALARAHRVEAVPLDVPGRGAHPRRPHHARDAPRPARPRRRRRRRTHDAPARARSAPASWCRSSAGAPCSSRCGSSVAGPAGPTAWSSRRPRRSRPSGDSTRRVRPGDGGHGLGGAPGPPDRRELAFLAALVAADRPGPAAQHHPPRRHRQRRAVGRRRARACSSCSVATAGRRRSPPSPCSSSCSSRPPSGWGRRRRSRPRRAHRARRRRRPAGVVGAAPGGWPSLVDGLKLAAPAALAGAIFGEWYGAERGLGVLLISGMQGGRRPSGCGRPRCWRGVRAGGLRRARPGPCRASPRRYGASVTQSTPSAARHRSRAWIVAAEVLTVAVLRGAGRRRVVGVDRGRRRLAARRPPALRGLGRPRRRARRLRVGGRVHPARRRRPRSCSGPPSASPRRWPPPVAVPRRRDRPARRRDGRHAARRPVPAVRPGLRLRAVDRPLLGARDGVLPGLRLRPVRARPRPGAPRLDVVDALGRRRRAGGSASSSSPRPCPTSPAASASPPVRPSSPRSSARA